MHTLLSLLFALFFISPALAAPAITADGAAALKPKLEQNLKHLADTLKTHGYVLQQTGTLTVEPADTYYAVTTPALALVMPNMVTRSIGMLAINAVPTDNPDILKIAMAIPTPMIDTSADGQTIGKTTIGGQSMTGIWHIAANMFTQVTANYKNIQSTDTTEGSQTNLSNLTIKMLLSEQADKTFSGPSEAVATGLTYTQDNDTYAIESAQMKSIVTGMDATTLIPASHSTNIQINNIGMKKNKPDGTTTTGAIKSITFDGSTSDLRSKLPSMSWAAAMNGFSTSDAALAKILPTTISMKAEANGAAITDFLEGAAQLNKEGSTLNLREFTIDAPAYGLTATASGKTTATGPQGQANITLRGLADLLASASQSSIPPMFTGILTMVQMTGKPAKDAQGRDTLTYDFQMGTDGKLMLNGTDMSGILGGGAKPPAALRSGSSAPAAP